MRRSNSVDKGPVALGSWERTVHIRSLVESLSSVRATSALRLSCYTMAISAGLLMLGACAKATVADRFEGDASENAGHGGDSGHGGTTDGGTAGTSGTGMGENDATIAFDSGRASDGGDPSDGDGSVSDFDAEAPDAASTSCFLGLERTAHRDADLVSVHGRAGDLGDVSYAIAGSSAGAGGRDGIQRFTNASSGHIGHPENIRDTGLWMWSGETVVEGMTYVAMSTDSETGPWINFRIYADNFDTRITCPDGSGFGSFTFMKFAGRVIEGTYEFQCPDANIDVRGCFRY